jgi:hypothetical protein
MTSTVTSTKLVRIALALSLLLLLSGAGAVPAFAQGPYYPLIVNGSPNLHVDYADGFLVVRFRRTLRGAGQPGTYVQNVPPGAGAWVDRPVNGQEPLLLKQKMTRDQAETAFQRLRQNGGYWKFYCRNTNAGYFDVSRSEAAYASVRID